MTHLLTISLLTVAWSLIMARLLRKIRRLEQAKALKKLRVRHRP